jgi:hypothetical protein
MRRSLSPALAAGLLLGSLAAAAEEPLPLARPETGGPPPAPQLMPPQAFAEAVEVGQQHWFGGHLFIGIPTGLRLQAAVLHRANRTWLLEGFAGVAPGGWFGTSVVGGGGRVNFTVFTDGLNDAFLIGPGVSVWSASEDRRTHLPVTVDFTWLHDFGPHVGCEFGVEVGIGPTLRGGGLFQFRHAYPIVSLFGGWRF